VLVAELLGDLNTLFRAVEALKPELARARDDLAVQCDRLRGDSAQLRERVEALVTQTQRGALTHLVAKTNELTAQACADIRRSMDEAAVQAWNSAATRRLELLASQLQSALQSAQTTASARRVARPGALLGTALLAGLVGFVVGALVAAALVHRL
jgi:hypothetical protein